jgi:hypothetical protein
MTVIFRSGRLWAVTIDGATYYYNSCAAARWAGGIRS